MMMLRPETCYESNDSIVSSFSSSYFVTASVPVAGGKVAAGAVVAGTVVVVVVDVVVVVAVVVVGPTVTVVGSTVAGMSVVAGLLLPPQAVKAAKSATVAISFFTVILISAERHGQR
jgi:hypothetical protein